MKILTGSQCQDWLNTNLRKGFTNRTIDEDYRHRVAYELPTDTGIRTALARAVSRSIDTKQHGLIWITAWGVFPSSQNMALFDAYRKSLGEERAIQVAPGHLFGESDLQQLECLLDLILYFYWDATLFDGAGTIMFKTSHDEYISICAKDKSGVKEFQNGLAGLKLKQIGAYPNHL